ncbi:hypothetical protein CB1_000849004 [Camelus ferus]|nr:hypothetical protein CB1_000849004 [Camelus ferus]
MCLGKEAALFAFGGHGASSCGILTEQDLGSGLVLFMALTVGNIVDRPHDGALALSVCSWAVSLAVSGGDGQREEAAFTEGLFWLQPRAHSLTVTSEDQQVNKTTATHPKLRGRPVLAAVR